jgi:hypothetical protein
VKAFSFDDHEAGFVAIGARPVGVIAIGGTPVGVVALGFASAGIVSVSVGVAGGVVALSCGLHVGFWSGGVGMSVGLKTFTVGGGVEVLERDEHVEEVRSRTRFDELAEGAVDADGLGEDVDEGWVVLRPLRWEGEWRLEAAGRVIELGDAAREALGDLPADGDLPRVAARVTVERSPDGASEAGYRAPPRQKLSLRCDEVAVESTDVERIVTYERDYLGMLWKAPVWLAAMAVVAFAAYGAIDDLNLDRRATATWKGQVRESNATDVPIGTACTATARLRTDGAARQKAAVSVECGKVTVYSDGTDARATIHQRAEDRGNRFSLAYVNAGRKPDHSGDENDDGKPSISVDTEAREVIVAHTYPAPWRVVVEVEPWSSRADPSDGRPLVEGGAAPAGSPSP